MRFQGVDHAFEGGVCDFRDEVQLKSFKSFKSCLQRIHLSEVLPVDNVSIGSRCIGVDIPVFFLTSIGQRSVDHQSSRQLAFTKTHHIVLSESCLREPDWNLRSWGFRERSHGQTWNKWNKRWTLQMRKEVAVIQFLFQHIRDDSGPWRKWANLSLWCMSVLGTGKSVCD